MGRLRKPRWRNLVRASAAAIAALRAVARSGFCVPKEDTKMAGLAIWEWMLIGAGALWGIWYVRRRQGK